MAAGYQVPKLPVGAQHDLQPSKLLHADNKTGDWGLLQTVHTSIDLIFLFALCMKRCMLQRALQCVCGPFNKISLDTNRPVRQEVTHKTQ